MALMQQLVKVELIYTYIYIYMSMDISILFKMY